MFFILHFIFYSNFLIKSVLPKVFKASITSGLFSFLLNWISARCNLRSWAFLGT